MGKKLYTLNQLPAQTWNRLGMNDASVAIPGVLKSFDPEVGLPNAEITEINTGMGDSTDELFIKTGAYSVCEDHTVKIVFSGSDTVTDLYFDVCGGSELTVIECHENSSGTVLNRIRFNISDNSKVNLIRVFRQSGSATVLSDCGALCSDDSVFASMHIILSGTSYIGLRSELSGGRAVFRDDTAYSIGGKELLDINYNIIHKGKGSLCDINVSGLLKDSAKKTFRGTIDFKRGSAGATGNELEEVMLLSDNVINQTVPLILCEEEDVEGNHGATIGKLSDELVFYLSSRGMTEEEIYAMISKARLERVIRMIPDEMLRCELTNSL